MQFRHNDDDDSDNVLDESDDNKYSIVSQEAEYAGMDEE